VTTRSNIVPAEARLPFHIRQGDVLLVAVDEIPADATLVAREGGRVVLALGEATGHAHVIRSVGTALLKREDQRYIRASAPAILDHEEHAAIEIPPGNYRVVIQREYVQAPVGPASWRSVTD
jgi:hypothetical protein